MKWSESNESLTRLLSMVYEVTFDFAVVFGYYDFHEKYEYLWLPGEWNCDERLHSFRIFRHFKTKNLTQMMFNFDYFSDGQRQIPQRSNYKFIFLRIAARKGS